MHCSLEKKDTTEWVLEKRHGTPEYNRTQRPRLSLTPETLGRSINFYEALLLEDHGSFEQFRIMHTKI